MKKPHPELYGININVLARLCKVSLKTAGRWKAGQTVPPKMALMLLSRSPGIWHSAWQDWAIGWDGQLVSPEGWEITVGDVMASRLQEQQIATLRSENRKLRGLAEEFAVDQPTPEEVTPFLISSS